MKPPYPIKETQVPMEERERCSEAVVPAPTQKKFSDIKSKAQQAHMHKERKMAAFESEYSPK